ncbi:MAG: heavy metal translocating P-type ATPase metal-binding domain-containing protein [Cytophagales bacterium]|nr:heavy metal translocating P-type ATPase metal-binding domain-containing protein [Cytophagales bacterium]MDW8384986.1 heavy metal translocating P-type ATPase metal-binding domain-containing protein [Flammeovirgaceae bacterium]
MSSNAQSRVGIECYHCGQITDEKSALYYDQKTFCCQGCKNVYQILKENHLEKYYELNKCSGISASFSENTYDYLDLPEIQSQIIEFTDGKIAKVTWEIPSIHCSSCIWLLENLHRIEKRIINSRVNFLRKTLSITFQSSSIRLSEVASLLARLGYAPFINLESENSQNRQTHFLRTEAQKKLILKIAVAGFCFGNIMLWSFPEYLGFDSQSQQTFKHWFSTLNVLLSIPVFFYSGRDYLISAWRSIREKYLNIDVPLAIGLIVLLIRSLYEIGTGTDAGYLDTLAGLVFFLLIGKWFQQFTYDTLRYDRDYESFFPLAVQKLMPDGSVQPIPIKKLQPSDRILVRNHELIPADSKLLSEHAIIDYSFVTGESMPVHVEEGQTIYAGGKQQGTSIWLEVIKPVSQSYLTQLWNQLDKKKDDSFETLQTTLSRYFTISLLGIAFGSLLFWGFSSDWSRGLNALGATLIIGCPCALALSSPFALGTAMRLLGKHKCYVKNTQTVEKIAQTDVIIFDKTGTITERSPEISFEPLQENLNVGTIFSKIYPLVSNSVHPLSIAIAEYIKNCESNYKAIHFQEVIGKGVSAQVEGEEIRIGNLSFVNEKAKVSNFLDETRVYVSINSTLVGYFKFKNKYRRGIGETIQNLQQKFPVYLLSGDNDSEKVRLLRFFESENSLKFFQKPTDKLAFVRQLLNKGYYPMMLGDGLNDAGALQSAWIGVAITENTALLTPAGDVILEASQITNIPNIIFFCQKAIRVVKISFGISLIYNAIGLSFAVSGTLSPLIAAILMPLSSLTVIGFTTLAVKFSESTLQKQLSK